MNQPVVAGNVSAMLPLSLLEAVRELDRPDEFLEDEDLMVSLPRRLGLTGVVDNQIRQYQTRRIVSLEELANLVRLILKREDASTILRETGRRVAEQFYATMPRGYRLSHRIMPPAVLLRSWVRSVHRMLRQMVGESRIEIAGRPPKVRLHPNPLGLLEPTGVACALYGSGLERLAELFTGRSPYSIETQCCASGDSCCEWTISGI